MTTHFIPYDQTKEMIPMIPVWHPNDQFQFVRSVHKDGLLSQPKIFCFEWDNKYEYYRGTVNGLEGYIAS